MTMAATPGPFVVMAKPVGPICNLSCQYCYYLGKKDLFPAGERYRMSDEVLEAYVRAFIAASPGPVVHFVWHGGEPTLAGVDFYRRVVKFQQRYLPDGWRCLNNLQTNGTLLDEKWCTFIAQEGFSVGLSIDGPASVHDLARPDHRGRPTQARAMRGLRLLKEHGVDPDVLCTVNAYNAAKPLEVYRYFLDHDVRWVQFLPVVEREPDGQVGRHSVAPRAFGEFLVQIFDEWVRHDVARIGVQNFLEPLLVVSGQPATLCVMAETCGLALAMEHDGSVYSCDHFVDQAHYLGNVLDSPPAPPGGPPEPAAPSAPQLGSFVSSPRQLAFGAAKKQLLPQYCRQCPVLFLCNGGCPKDRLAQSPTGEDGLNYLCEGYRAFYSHALPYLRRMAGLSAAGHPVSAIMAQLESEERDDRRRWASTGRNDPCPCGSGKKFKLCCLPKFSRD